MPAPRPFRVIGCKEWGARPADRPIARAGRPDKAIFHHTAGHVPNLSAGETYAEAVAYAKLIQRIHMAPPRNWNDSGHNFLVTRGGYVLEGRHSSLEAVTNGRMVVSAHCPGQNDQPGVEIEHNGNEPMTPIQREAAVWLFAMLCREGGFPASEIYPHRQFVATDCPGALAGDLPAFRRDVAAELGESNPELIVRYDLYAGKEGDRKRLGIFPSDQLGPRVEAAAKRLRQGETILIQRRKVPA